MSIFGPREDVRALFANVHSVIGSGPIVDENVGGDPCFHLRGQYRGHPIHALISTDGGILFSVRFGVPLGDRAITLLLSHRRNTNVHGVPEVRTGDARFDGLFLLNGCPPSALQAALDRPTRAWLVEQFSAREPTLSAERGEVSLRVVLQKSFSTVVRQMPATEVASWLDALLPIADRLGSAFDEERAHIAHSQGDRAADDWVQGLASVTQARAIGLGQLRPLVYAAIGLPIVLTLLVAGLAIVVVLASR